jgi:hypothetical protein
MFCFFKKMCFLAVDGSASRQPGINGIYLLSCWCGEVGRRSHVASLLTRRDTLEWEGFYQPHHPMGDYSAFETFVFDRRQYEANVDQLVSDLQDTDASGC